MILLVSDTHDDKESFKRIVFEYKNSFLSALIHLGDVTDFKLLESASILDCEKYLVKGNNDIFNSSSCSYLKSIGFEFSNPPFEIFIEGYGHIAIMHEPYFKEEFIADSKTSYIFYGHSHRPEKRQQHDKWIVNPGSLSSFLSIKHSYALIEKDKITIRSF